MPAHDIFYDRHVERDRNVAFSQYKPSEISIPIRTGVYNALSRLNYEFSGAKDIVKANSKVKKVPMFIKSGAISVGENILANIARNIIVAAIWRTGSTFLGDLLDTIPGSF